MSLWLADRPLVLASKSESRRATLENAGIPIEIHPADIHERGKADAIATGMPGRLVRGADQTLALGTRGFSKPVDVAAAGEQLKALRGRTHELHSAVALSRDGATVFEHVEVARLTMRDFSDGFLDAYLGAAGK